MGRARHCRNPGVLWVKRVASTHSGRREWKEVEGGERENVIIHTTAHGAGAAVRWMVSL